MSACSNQTGEFDDETGARARLIVELPGLVSWRDCSTGARNGETSASAGGTSGRTDKNIAGDD